MPIIIHSAENRTPIAWASGTSTEMFIHPSDGSFAERRFLFRISTATVEAEESTFTFFEGITRHLMILRGELELVHEGRYTKHLKPYDGDTFSGEWPTRSKGKVTDFNLMLKGDASGSLTHHVVTAGNPLSLSANADFCFAYVADGSFVLPDGRTARTGDLLQLINEQGLQLDGEGDVIGIHVSTGD